MCGIVGIWSFKNQIDRRVLNSMNETLKHRGPDDSGLYVDDEHCLGLGHSRLSILDLSSLGHQPMSNDNKTIWTSFNGEIYNFRQIRRDLINKGHTFRSNSDTEVVVKAYEQWGIDCIERFRGMFAIAIWDKNNNRLYLTRDRAGVKPLYYYFHEGLFLFGSELKALMKHPAFLKDINYESIQLYLRYGYIPAPYSIFKNTYKLKPGNYLCITENKIEEKKYWDITDYYQKQSAKKEDEIIEELEQILIDSFKYRLVSDVPVGVFLSGGIDSSVLTALLAKNVDSSLKTFSIGFHESSFNEAEWAKKVANHLNTDHTEYYLSANEGLNMIKDLPEIYDEPFGDNSALPTYLLSKITRNDVKVALSADGGDELFSGYNRYSQCLKINNINSKIPKALRSFLNTSLAALSPDLIDSTYRKIRFIFPDIQNLRYKYIKFREMFRYSSLGDSAGMYRAACSYWMTDEIDNIMLNQKHSSDTNKIEENIFSQLSSNGLLSQMMTTDFKYYLADDILTKLDRASMSVGLEARDPFLDQNIIEYAAGIEADLHNKNGESKYLLRRILYKYVPKELVERPKQGFSMPLQFWLQDDLNEMMRDYLSHERIKKGGIFNAETITKLVDDFKNGSTINVNSIWCILMFEMWRERWLQS